VKLSPSKNNDKEKKNTMHMNEKQALRFCRSQEAQCVGHVERDKERSSWNHLITEITEQGLDAAKTKCRKIDNISPSDPTAALFIVNQKFLKALTDNDLIWPFIARDLKRELSAIDTGPMDLAQKLYHYSFLDHLDQVEDGDAEMLDYADLKEMIHTDMERIEKKYGKYIREAQLQQPKETE
jgi:hypothetical protein